MHRDDCRFEPLRGADCTKLIRISITRFRTVLRPVGHSERPHWVRTGAEGACYSKHSQAPLASNLLAGPVQAVQCHALYLPWQLARVPGEYRSFYRCHRSRSGLQSALFPPTTHVCTHCLAYCTGQIWRTCFLTVTRWSISLERIAGGHSCYIMTM